MSHAFPRFLLHWCKLHTRNSNVSASNDVGENFPCSAGHLDWCRAQALWRSLAGKLWLPSWVLTPEELFLQVRDEGHMTV